MKKINYSLLISWLVLLIGCSGIWFRNVYTPPIDPDEVAWVLDARFYNFRQQKQWDKFILVSNPISLGWSHDQYRLVDQPQLGKYIYGFVLNIFKQDPWDPVQTKFLYQQFAKRAINSDDLKGDQTYSEMVRAVNLLRALGSIAGFMGIAIFGLGVSFLTKDRLVGGLTSILLFSHPTLFYWYRLAVPNSFQITLIVVALIIMFILLNKVKNLTPKISLGWFLSGVLVASASSIKLNGFLLIAAPIVIWLVQELLQVIFNNELLKHILNQSKAYFFFIVGFVTTFFFWEVELWKKPLVGIGLLFGSRLSQHYRFLAYYENYSIFETIQFLLVQFLKLSDLLAVKILIGLFLAWGMIKIISMRAERYWSNLLLLIFFVVIANTYYANVGFDRYAEWSIYVFSFVSAFGAVDFSKTIYHKTRQLCQK
jgi:hypothetical protein